MRVFCALDVHSSLSSALIRWSIPAQIHRLIFTKSLGAYVESYPTSQDMWVTNRDQNSFNVTMDPQKGHDLAKLSTCTTCEMAEDFSKSSSIN
jgi:hypothetical protein